MTAIAVVAGVIAFISLFRERLRSLPLTTPMLFVFAGMFLAPEALGLIDGEFDDEVIAFTAELTLALLLFSDAAPVRWMS